MSVLDMAGPDTGQAPAQKSSGKRPLLLGLVLVLVVAAAAYWFLFRPTVPEPEPVPGEVFPIEAIQVNLEGGHYLRIGLALQLVEGAHELDGSKALDTTIELFTGQDMEELAKPGYRNKLKSELVHHLDEQYEGEVLDVYFTDFVTQ